MEVELVFSVDRGAKLSLHEQLADQFRRAILQKRLVPGDSVPASRPLAQQLGISRGTVVSVLEQLAGEGYLEVHPGKGHFVAALDHLGQYATSESEPLTSPVATTAAERPRPALDLRPGYPSVQGLGQDRLWKSAWRKAITHLPDAVFHEEEPSGSPRLRTAIAEHLRRARGISADPEHIHITGGTAEALVLITLTLNRIYGTAQIAVENPGYPAARQALEAAGAQLQTVATGSEGIAMGEVPTGVHAVVTTPSHQYPLGGLMSVKDRLVLLEWAQRHEAVVVEDDYDSEFRYDRPPLPALSSLSQRERVMTIGSFSKVLTPALRTGYIYADGALGRELMRTRAEIGAPVSYLQQTALAEYLESGGLARHIAKMRREYRHRRDLLLRRLSGIAGVQVSATSGGLHAVLHTPVPAPQLAAQLGDRGTAVALLSSYYAEGLPEDEDGLVIGYGQVPGAQLSHALGRIEGTLAANRGPTATLMPKP